MTEEAFNPKPRFHSHAVSPTALKSSTLKSDRAEQRANFKLNCWKGSFSLKELIDKYYAIESRFLLLDFEKGLRTDFALATIKSKKRVGSNGLKPLTLQAFL